MVEHSDLTTVLALFFADVGVHTNEEAELGVAVVLRADHYREARGASWSTFDVEGFLAHVLPERLRRAGGALVLSTFCAWLADTGELSRERALELSERAVAFAVSEHRAAA